MKIKCMALDMDGTLLQKGGVLSAKNKEAVQAAIDQGVEIVIASGRAFGTLPEEVLEMPGIRYAITSNGSSIYEISTGKLLHGFVLTPASVDAILTVTRDDPVTYEVFVAGQPYSDVDYVKDPVKYGVSEQSVAYVQSTRQSVDDIIGFIRDHDQELESLAVIVGDPRVKQEVTEKLGREVPDIYITSSVPQLIEISREGTGKHTALAYIADQQGFAREEVAAFGNADNDAEMLAWAGVGVAVADASESCLEAADLIVKSCAENGVAQGIEELLSQT